MRREPFTRVIATKRGKPLMPGRFTRPRQIKKIRGPRPSCVLSARIPRPILSSGARIMNDKKLRPSDRSFFMRREPFTRVIATKRGKPLMPGRFTRPRQIKKIRGPRPSCVLSARIPRPILSSEARIMNDKKGLLQKAATAPFSTGSGVPPIQAAHQEGRFYQVTPRLGRTSRSMMSLGS